MKSLSRRRFFEQSVMAAAAAALPTEIPTASAASSSPNERIQVAILGCGIRGKAHAKSLAALKDCDIVSICDPDLDRVDEVAALLTGELGRPEPKKEQDLRKVIEDPSIDAVFIASPNHWHALSAIWAMQAGKDVYVEKPVSQNVQEGRLLVETARALGRICQTGTQNRSRGPLAEAVQFMREGGLGEVKLARSVFYGRRGSIGGPVDCAIPPRCNYDLWAGPAPMAKLTRQRFHYDWHWMWDTGNGDIGNSNVHSIDICRWGLGVEGLGDSVISYGGRLGYEDVGETPNSQVAVFRFGDKTLISETRGLKTEPFHPRIQSMWFFYGSEGIIADTGLYDPEGTLLRSFEGRSVNHFANFLEAVRSRRVEDLKADILEGHLSSALCHLANISYRLGQPAAPAEIQKRLEEAKLLPEAISDLEQCRHYLEAAGVNLEETPLTMGRPLQLEQGQERFLGDEEANALLSREYRAPYTLPTAIA